MEEAGTTMGKRSKIDTKRDMFLFFFLLIWTTMIKPMLDINSKAWLMKPAN